MATETTFPGSTAIVTGAASGIGRALATALVERGAHVVLADIDDVGVKAAAEELAGRGGKVTPVVLDVTDAAAFAALVAQAADESGRVDLLFNNAGIGVGGPVRDMTTAHFDRVIDVNLRGVVHGVMAAYPRMCDQGSGHIVNTASLAGLISSPMLTPYGAAKHAVVGLSTSLRAEAAAHGVRVSVICPGVIDTPLLDKGNPADLPGGVEFPNGRKLLTKSIGRAYPADLLARDVLDGVRRNRAFIVTPRHARMAWRIHRAAPELFQRGLPAGLRRITRLLSD
ncbi:MAG TPA: SDR family oxidoreductase [Acidimicrobiales bacterium]|nr:SDR family oxidoreductase [Acidimicrobiales bacterium]